MLYHISSTMRVSYVVYRMVNFVPASESDDIRICIVSKRILVVGRGGEDCEVGISAG